MRFEFTTQQTRAVDALCRRYAVRRLALFGSAVRGDFDQLRSDLDFVVDFGPPPHNMGLVDQYFGLVDELESLLGRTVDLVERPAVRNPYFRKSVEDTEVGVYAA